MNSEQLEDLKQFITATVSQQAAGFVTKEDLAGLATKEDIAGTEKRLIKRMDERFDNVDLRINEILNEIGADIVQMDKAQKRHEDEIVKLKHKYA